jgi:hypothetical protein
MGIRAVQGQNDLETTHPDLAAQWHPTLNGEVLPSNVTAGSGQMRWWLCSSGHPHQDTPNHKKSGRGCPVCSNKQILVGVNDLATTNPDLARQWHPTKNAELLSTQVSNGSYKKVWWICDLRHEWQSVVYSRINSGGCPVCSNKILVQGVNDLATTNPKLAKEWHPTKNGAVTPEQVFAGTPKRYWWICSSGHEWQTGASERSLGKGCPVCSGQKLLQGTNDFKTTHPELAKEWNATKNKGLQPDDFIAGGHRKFWWICSSGHEWQTSIANRKRGRNCPNCLKPFIYKGVNLLSETNPKLAEEWHPTKNTVSIEKVAAGSHLKVWWKCELGHEWEAGVYSRNSGRNCPYCSNTKILGGFNDLETKAPELAKEWHPKKNLPLTINQVSLGSNVAVWWVCDKGHEWKASTHNRSKGQGCAVCVNRQLTVGLNDLTTTHPHLAKEWHPHLNLPVLPTEVITGTAKKFWWVCDEGHEWQATGNSRRNGSNCPACSQSGFDSTKPATLYFIQHQKLLARKVGITNTNARIDRLREFKKLGWEVLATFESDPGLKVQTTEQLFFKWLRKDLGIPAFLAQEDLGVLGGWSETFSLEGLSNDFVVRKLESLLGERPTKSGSSKEM